MIVLTSEHAAASLLLEVGKLQSASEQPNSSVKRDALKRASYFKR